MASEKKKRKLKNSYCVKGALKNKTLKLKKVLFFTSSQRKVNNEVPEWAENAVSQMNLEMLLLVYYFNQFLPYVL